MKIILNFESRQATSGPNEQVFIEAHDENGKSIDVGEWATDGEYETLTIDCAKLCRNATVEQIYAGQSNTNKLPGQS